MDPQGQLRRVGRGFRDGDMFTPRRRSGSDVCDVVVAKLLAVEAFAFGVDESQINSCLLTICDGTRPEADDDVRSAGDIDTVYYGLEELSVRAGELVAAGQQLGQVPPGRRVYLGISEKGAPQDPRAYVSLGVQKQA